MEWKNKRNWETSTTELDRWWKAKWKSKAVLIICIFLFNPFFIFSFFENVAWREGCYGGSGVEGENGSLCVFEESELAFAPSLFAWNRTNESKNVFSLVLMSTVYKYYIWSSTIRKLKRYWKQLNKFLSYLKRSYNASYLLQVFLMRREYNFWIEMERTLLVLCLFHSQASSFVHIDVHLWN